MQLGDMNYIHAVIQPSPPSVSKSFASPYAKTRTFSSNSRSAALGPCSPLIHFLSMNWPVLVFHVSGLGPYFSFCVLTYVTLAQCFQDASMLWHVSKLHSFLWLNNSIHNIYELPHFVFLFINFWLFPLF